MRKTRFIIQGLFFTVIIAAVFFFKKNVELWCPFGGIECLYLYIKDGKMLCSLSASNFFAIASIILMTLILKRVFCGYICPLGALAEAMRRLAGVCGFKQIRVPMALNKVLNLSKYIVLALILWGTARATELIFRPADPCFALLGYSSNEEVEMSTYIALGIFIVCAFLISMPFCRWFCPLAAVLNLGSRWSMARISRDSESCIDCGKCTRVCPMALDVAVSDQVSSADCISCMECLDACPVQKKGALQWKIGKNTVIGNPKKVLISAIVLCVLFAAGANYSIAFATFRHTRDIDAPEKTAQCHIQVDGISCSGSTRLLVFFLDRNDIFAVPGYLALSTSPASGFVDVDITYDPALADANTIIDAIREPLYDQQEKRWRDSPFSVKGHDILDDLE